MNNFKNNNRRGRFKPNGDRGFRRNGNGHKQNGDFSNGSSFKRRHPGKNNQNASKLVEKYNDLAREALSTGDKILSESYYQFSDHYLRVLKEREKNQKPINFDKDKSQNEKSDKDKDKDKDEKVVENKIATS